MTGEYFDPGTGRWITPEDEFTGDTGASVKEIKGIIAELHDPSNDTYDRIDRVLYTYYSMLRHGETSHLGKRVEWFLNEELGRVYISFKDGGEWFDDEYAEDVPVYLLLAILRAVQRKKPLGDHETDETAKTVRDLEAVYVRKKHANSLRDITLNTLPEVNDGE
jgi:hypothetical protein